MAGMIEMPPPPEPPELEPDKIRALIDYADSMAAFMEAEMKLDRELGKTTPENHHDYCELARRLRGSPALGLRDDSNFIFLYSIFHMTY